MGYQMFALFPEVVTFRHHGHDGIIALVGLHVGQQHNHGNITGYREDIDRCRRLLSDIDLLVRYVIAYGKRLWGTNGQRRAFDWRIFLWSADFFKGGGNHHHLAE